MKIEVCRIALENVDVQEIEVPKGSRLLSVVSSVNVSSVVGVDGQRQATPNMSVCVGFNPDVKETERYKIYILGMGIPNELPDTATLLGHCSFANGMIVFHVYYNKKVE